MKTHSTLLRAVLLVCLSALGYAQAPVPFVNQPLQPDATAPGGPQFTLTVNGTGFVSSSVVNWNGNALATQFVSASQLAATVPAANIATDSTASVTVATPAPGGGTSNVAFFSVTANTGDSVGFAVTSNPSVGSYPISVALGDFNGDGKLDLTTANFYSNTLSILLGDGKGNFSLASSPAVGAYPSSIAVGDFNGDGKLDLATTGNYAVSILLGDGTGKFTLASSLPYGGSSVAEGDFNGDGNLDLAVANCGSGVCIFLGDGTGKFTLASSPPYGGSPVVVGDFNGDGKLDLAVAGCDSGLCILSGDGTGNFTLASSPPYSGSSIAVGDFNGDGKLDLTLAACGNGACILLGDGTGNFTLGSSPNVDAGAVAVAVADFNGDGKLDIAVTRWWYDSTVSILLGAPSGPAVALFPASLTFGAQLLGTSSNPQSVTLTNFGGATLDITGVTTSPNFSQTHKCPIHLPPGGQCTLNVIFTPRRINAIAGSITIADNAPNSPQTIALTGVGTAMTLSPASLDFGVQQLGVTSPPQTVTFTNYGQQSVSVRGIYFTGSNPTAFAWTSACGTTVPAGGSCTFAVTFTAKTTGAKRAMLDVSDTGGASPQTVSLTGAGTDVTLSPTSLDFGKQLTGTTSPPQTVTLTNNGTTALGIIGMRFTGPNGGNFDQTNNCGTSVPAGGSCAIDVTFTPSSRMHYGGPRHGTLNVSDYGGGSPQTVAVSGIAID